MRCHRRQWCWGWCWSRCRLQHAAPARNRHWARCLRWNWSRRLCWARCWHRRWHWSRHLRKRPWLSVHQRLHMWRHSCFRPPAFMPMMRSRLCAEHLCVVICSPGGRCHRCWRASGCRWHVAIRLHRWDRRWRERCGQRHLGLGRPRRRHRLRCHGSWRRSGRWCRNQDAAARYFDLYAIVLRELWVHDAQLRSCVVAQRDINHGGCDHASVARGECQAAH